MFMDNIINSNNNIGDILYSANASIKLNIIHG